LARPKSAVGWCWRAARRPAASIVHPTPSVLIAFLDVSVVFGARYGRRRRFSGAGGANSRTMAKRAVLTLSLVLTVATRDATLEPRLETKKMRGAMKDQDGQKS
jgi:hypothetical protein